MSPDNVDAELAERFKLYEAYMAAKKYPQAEQVCQRALSLCGYQNWAWAYFLAETYYPRAMYVDAERYYAFAASVLLKEPPVHPTLPRCLMFLAYTEAFLGKEKLASEHWKQAMNYFAWSKGLPPAFTPESKVSIKATGEKISINHPPEAWSGAFQQFCREHQTEIMELFPPAT